jgi:hypothetical protein
MDEQGVDWRCSSLLAALWFGKNLIANWANFW